MQSNIGVPIASADFDITVTGQAMTSAIGDAGQESSYAATGNLLTSATGVAQVKIDVVFTASGVSATSSTGDLRGTFWSEVDDSQTAVWVEVDKAA